MSGEVVVAADGTEDVPLLAVDDLTIAFGSGVEQSTVVHELSFSISAGRTLGLVGESGSGKSMTSLSVMGLLPPGARASGAVHLGGGSEPRTSLLGLREKAMRRLRGERVGMVFQDPLSSLNPYYPVGFQIAEAYRTHRRVGAAQARRVAIAAMDRVRIADAARRSEQYPHQFSGGMRQRIMIAMALVCEPELLIADEPTTALDVTVQSQILDLLRTLQDETGIAMLFITHDLAVVSEMADSVLVLQHGEQVEAGTAEQIFSDPRQAYTRRLLDATPRIDAPWTEEGVLP